MARHVQADLETEKINMHIDVINFPITTSHILFLHYVTSKHFYLEPTFQLPTKTLKYIF